MISLLFIYWIKKDKFLQWNLTLELGTLEMCLGWKSRSFLTKSNIAGKFFGRRLSFSVSFVRCFLLGSMQYFTTTGVVVGFHTCEKFLETFGLDRAYLARFVLFAAPCWLPGRDACRQGPFNQEPKTKFSQPQPTQVRFYCWASLLLVTKWCLVGLPEGPWICWAPNPYHFPPFSPDKTLLTSSPSLPIHSSFIH